MAFKELPLNQRINLKALFEAWAKIAIERFQEKEIDPKIYQTRTSRRGVQRTQLGKNYRFGQGPSFRNKRTFNLRTNWRSAIMASGASGALQISFPLYGRFVDMGVGNGVDAAMARYARRNRHDEAISRKPKRWYSKRKAYETHRLRELMSRYYVDLPMDLIENALANTTLTYTI